MKKSVLLSALVCLAALGADKMTAPQLIAVANDSPGSLQAAITATFDPKDLKAGGAWSGSGPDFFFVTEASSKPKLMIDDSPGPEMKAIAGSNLWYAAAKIGEVGRLHAFYYMVGGAKFGGKLDVPAFTPLSYLEAGVPSGTLSEKLIHTSKMYDGMKSEYWIYVPAQYDAKTPASLMVFQDGGGYLNRNGNNPA
jgi:hypothetical protein